MGGIDILLAFPALILAIALTSLLGASVRNVIIAIAVLALPAFTRVARAQTLAFAQRDFVKAARSVGASDSRIIFREIAPNVMPTMVSYALVIVAVAIVVEGALSFLGLSVSAEIPTWGGMIDAGRGDLERAAHISLIPAATMFLTVLAFNSVGDKLARRYGGARAGVA
jgi:peptide/nickel transport system permease protein